MFFLRFSTKALLHIAPFKVTSQITRVHNVPINKILITPVQSYELTFYLSITAFLHFNFFLHCAGMTSNNVPSNTESVRNCSGTLATIHQFMTGDQENLRPSLYWFIWEPEAVLHRIIKTDSAGKHTIQRRWWRLCCLELNSEGYVMDVMKGEQ